MEFKFFSLNSAAWEEIIPWFLNLSRHKYKMSGSTRCCIQARNSLISEGTSNTSVYWTRKQTQPNHVNTLMSPIGVATFPVFRRSIMENSIPSSFILSNHRLLLETQCNYSRKRTPRCPFFVPLFLFILDEGIFFQSLKLHYFHALFISFIAFH